MQSFSLNVCTAPDDCNKKFLTEMLIFSIKVASFWDTMFGLLKGFLNKISCTDILPLLLKGDVQTLVAEFICTLSSRSLENALSSTASLANTNAVPLMRVL